MCFKTNESFTLYRILQVATSPMFRVENEIKS